jgi:hypothetical protein
MIRSLCRVAAVAIGLVVATTACADAPEGESDAPGRQGSDAAGTSRSTGMAPNLVVTILGCDRAGDSLRTRGSIRNQGQEDVRYIDVSLAWADSAGTLVASDVAAIVGGETLMSGDSVVFDVATAHPLASRCSEARIFFYEPIP